MKDMSDKELQDEKASLYTELRGYKDRIDKAVTEVNRLRNNWHILKNTYEGIDRELALRHKLTVVTRTTKPPELTLDQIVQIANKLGIKVDEGGDK